MVLLLEFKRVGISAFTKSKTASTQNSYGASFSNLEAQDLVAKRILLATRSPDFIVGGVSPPRGSWPSGGKLQEKKLKKKDFGAKSFLPIGFC